MIKTEIIKIRGKVAVQFYDDFQRFTLFEHDYMDDAKFIKDRLDEFFKRNCKEDKP